MQVKIKDKILNITKWKAKTKKDFVNIMKSGSNVDLLQDVLVYNHLEEKYALSPDEFKYVLTQLRSFSIGEEIELEFYCEECKSKYVKTINLNEIIKPVYEDKKIINTDNYIIKIGEIKNSDFYRKVINESENPKELDFFLRIEEINEDDSFTLDEIIKTFDEMDIDDYESIFNQWESIKFKVDDTSIIECSNCNHSVKYSFDEIPGFFPKSWFE